MVVGGVVAPYDAAKRGRFPRPDAGCGNGGGGGGDGGGWRLVTAAFRNWPLVLAGTGGVPSSRCPCVAGQRRDASTAGASGGGRRWWGVSQSALGMRWRLL